MATTVGPSDTLIIGLGNDFRGDDAVGLEVARRLKALVPDGLNVIEVGGDPMSAIDMWSTAETVIVIDAVMSGVEPGTVHKHDVTDASLPSAMGSVSTHFFGLGELIELARAVGKFPRRLVVQGIEGQDFGIGAQISDVCRVSIDRVVDAVLEEVGCMSTR